MRTLLQIIAGIFFLTDAAFANKDSVGVKAVNGKMFILHKVTKGEGLYGIGRKYGTTPASIQQANSSAKNGIAPGQVIMVPYIKGAKNASAVPAKKTSTTKPSAVDKTPLTATATRAEKSPIYHTVTPGETMYRVAKKHKIQVADIAKWNDIKGNEISVGQKIIVGYTTKQVAVKTEKVLPNGSVRTDKPAPKVEVAVNEKAVEEKPVIENKPKKGDYIDKKYEDQYAESQKLAADNTKKGKSVWKEVQESGVASWIDDGSIVTEKKLALHKTAPVGTVIKLKNPMNDAVVFVKVIGRLPQDNSEDNVLIKITKSTADKLGLRDKYSRLDMSYGMEVTK